jgi:CRP-like cAMP-binding protein
MPGMVGKDVIRGCLKAVPLFSELPDAELDTLAAACRSVVFKKGARIFEEGAPADCCFVLTGGRAQVVLSGNSGAEILLHIVLPTGLVGEVALLDKSDRSASLVAVEQCHLIRIPIAAFEALRKNPAFENKLVTRLVTRLRESDDRVRVISTFPSINRVAWCLARIARYSGRREGATIVVPTTSHSELAEMAGCTRETVSRALHALKRKKYVAWDRTSMRLDVEGMQRYLTTELRVPPGPPPV